MQSVAIALATRGVARHVGGKIAALPTDWLSVGTAWQALPILPGYAA